MLSRFHVQPSPNPAKSVSWLVMTQVRVDSLSGFGRELGWCSADLSVEIGGFLITFEQNTQRMGIHHPRAPPCTTQGHSPVVHFSQAKTSRKRRVFPAPENNPTEELQGHVPVLRLQYEY